MLFFVTGASGSGKTACMGRLQQLTPEISWHDFDQGGVPPDADIAWRHRRTEHWLREAIQHQSQGRDLGICGGAIYGEILACPSAPQVDGIAVCLLDCYDVVRIDRLRQRGPGCDTQETLCWAAWQRMHAVDPQWRQDVIRSGGAPEMQWERWEDWQRGDKRWGHTWRLDTTDLAIEEVAGLVLAWVSEAKQRPITGNSYSL